MFSQSIVWSIERACFIVLLTCKRLTEAVYYTVTDKTLQTHLLQTFENTREMKKTSPCVLKCLSYFITVYFSHTRQFPNCIDWTNETVSFGARNYECLSKKCSTFCSRGVQLWRWKQLKTFCDLRVLAWKLASPFGHPMQVIPGQFNNCRGSPNRPFSKMAAENLNKSKLKTNTSTRKSTLT